MYNTKYSREWQIRKGLRSHSVGHHKVWEMTKPSSRFLLCGSDRVPGAQSSQGKRPSLFLCRRAGFVVPTVLVGQLRGTIESVFFSWQALRNALREQSMVFSLCCLPLKILSWCHLCSPWTLWKHRLKNKIRYLSIQGCSRAEIRVLLVLTPALWLQYLAQYQGHPSKLEGV